MNNGLPDAIIFMTPEYRYNWVRYGNISFLDASKSEINNIGWPYMAPTIRTSECKIGQTSEAIVLIETHEIYSWILYMHMNIEPRRNLLFIRLIFGDDLITRDLLNGI